MRCGPSNLSFLANLSFLVVAGSITVAGPALAQSGDQSGDDSSTDQAAAPIVATQLRAQGYKCDDPHSAEPDKNATTPGEEAWIVNCDNASYAVKLVPGQAAKVEQLD